MSETKRMYVERINQLAIETNDLALLDLIYKLMKRWR